MTAPTAPPVHDLLLALAGHLDDDLLAWARELLAVGERDQAVELATAALAAERVVLPPPLRTALVASARAAGTDLDVERALAPGRPEPGTPHRFDAAAASGDAVVAALTALPARRLAGCTLHLTWRRTPAGAAPGPLPHAVVLVEADPDRSTEVLAYLLATELDRAGAPASVEVFTAGAALPPYHAAALDGAREVVRGAGGEAPEVLGGSRHGRVDPTATPLFLVPSPASDVPEEPDRADALPAGSDGAAADTETVELPGPPVEVHPVEARRPAGRRRRAEPDVADVAAAPGPEPAPETPGAPGPARVGTAPEPDAPDTDPLNGPLRVPLLAPLLDPTAIDRGHADPEAFGPDERGPYGTDTGHSAAPNEPAAAPPPADPEPTGPEPTGPERTGTGPPGGVDVPAEWEEDWRTGEWAMPPGRPGSSHDRAGPDAAVDLFGTPPPLFPEAEPGRPPDHAEGRTEGHAEGPGGGHRNGGTRLFGVVRRAGRRAEPPPASTDEVSLFESPTARVDPGSGAPPRHPDELPAHRWTGEPGRRRAVPAEDEPPPGADPSDVPLFGPTTTGHPVADEPRPGRRRRPDEPTPPGPPGARPPAGRPTPFGDPALPGAAGRLEPGPEPSALLGGTERDLLAQLQAELGAQERRPRPYRRAGQNGSARTVNGHGHSGRPDDDRPPPDLAG